MKANAILLFGLLVSLLSCDARNSQEASSVSSAHDENKGASRVNFSLLPKRNVLAITPENMCKGLRNAMENAKQVFTEEVNALCVGTTPTPMFNQLLATPYAGIGQTTINEIFNDELNNDDDDDEDPLVKLFVTYSMRINKQSVPLLLGEEPYVRQANYDEDGFSISFKFIAPPLNEGDADTGFRVEQYAAREGSRVEFDDVSLHDLKLYRLHENNFDFLLAARTLVAPTEQFKKSVALRVVMPDPVDTSKSISISVMNFTMNGRGEESRLLDVVLDYVKADMLSVYAFHNQ